MAGAISLSINRGNDGFHISDFTVGTNAPAANDAEFRFNNTDLNGAVLTKKDLTQILEAITRAIQSDALFVNMQGL